MSGTTAQSSLGGRFLQANSPRLLIAVAWTVVVIIIVAGVLSFRAQMELAAAGGIPAAVAWGWPIIVDGTIVVATVAVLILHPRGRGVVAYAWAILGVFGAVSMIANGVHALDMGLAPEVRFGIGAVPAVALLLSTHLLVLMLTSPAEHTVAAALPATEPSPVAEDVPAAPVSVPAPASVSDPVPTPPVTQVSPVQSVPVQALPGTSEQEVEARIVSVLHETGELPSGTTVGEWLGRSRSVGSRFRKQLAERNPEVAAALGLSPTLRAVND